MSILTEKILPVLLPTAALTSPLVGYYASMEKLPDDAHPHVKNVRHILGGLTNVVGIPGALATGIAAKANPLAGLAVALPASILGFLGGKHFGRTANKEQQQAVRLIRRNDGMLLGQEKKASEISNRLAAALYAGVPGAIGGAFGGAGMNLAASAGDESPESYAESAIRGALIGGILSALVGGAMPIAPSAGTGLGSAAAGAIFGSVPGALRGAKE